MHELLVYDTTFGERSKVPLNLAKSGDWVSALITFQMEEVKQGYLKDSVKKVFFLEND